MNLYINKVPRSVMFCDYGSCDLGYICREHEDYLKEDHKNELIIVEVMASDGTKYKLPFTYFDNRGDHTTPIRDALDVEDPSRSEELWKKAIGPLVKVLGGSLEKFCLDPKSSNIRVVTIH